MHATIVLTTLVALLSSTTATSVKHDAVYHGISLYFVTDIPGQRYTQSPAPVEINKLAITTGGTASAIRFDRVEVNVDLNKVECRLFSGADGVVPIGKPFNRTNPIVLSTDEVVPIGSILCYVATDREVANF